MSNSKTFTLAELCQGLDVEIKGDSQCRIDGICTVQAGKPNHITFLQNPHYQKYLADTKAAAVILSAEHAKACHINAVITRDPYFIWAKIAAKFSDTPLAKPGIHATAVIGEHCQIDPTASIGAHCVIGDHVQIGAGAVIAAGSSIGEYTQIGAQTRLDAHVTVYHRIVIGARVHINSGTVVGSEGFGIAKHQGAWTKVPQLGRVVIEDDVDIGANCTLDRGAIEDTVIEQGAQIDNLVQIAHNVRIGAHTAIAGCVGISGSTTIGSHCLIGGTAAFAGHLTIANNTVIMGGTEVSKSIQKPGIYASGIGGLVTNLERRKNSARVMRLGQLQTRVAELEKALQLTTVKENEE
jgi:UDP-3-O-[3-hydroxymyristoyl] glucosamine N-acyltransferase